MDNFFDFSKMTIKDSPEAIPAAEIIKTYNGCIDDMPLTMAYVPFQKTIITYEPETGLSNGTIFPCLDKPFYECSKRWRDAK